MGEFMNISSKILVILALMTGIAIQGAEVERKEDAEQVAAQEALDEKLLDAILAGSIERVRTLLLEKENPNSCIDQTTPLSKAIRYGHVDIVKLLLDQGADANQEPNNPLRTAIECMDYHILNENTDYTERCIHIVKLLLDNNADPNKRSPIGCTPFTKCVENYRSHNGSTSYLKTLKLLLEYGADDTTSYNGKTIHDDAETNPELQRILKEHADKTKEKIAATWSALPMDVVQLCADKLHVTDHDRALYKAVEDREVEKVKTLLKKNANPHVALDFYGNKKPVLYKTFDHWGTKYFESAPLVSLLLQAKADPNCTYRLASSNFKPLDSADITLKSVEKMYGKESPQCADILQCAELLLHHGTDVHALTIHKTSLISGAAENNCPRMVTIYLKYGADTDETFQKHAHDKPKILQAYEEHRQRCRERIADAVPQLARPQDFGFQGTDLAARIAEYI